jgi:hypothetical protein
MSLRPRADEVIRGIERSLAEHVLPELRTPYAIAQLQYAIMLLRTVRNEWDGAAERLVEDNRALRALAERTAATLETSDHDTAGELRAAASEDDTDLRMKKLGESNDRLRALHTHALAALSEDAAGEARTALHGSVSRRMPGAIRPR